MNSFGNDKTCPVLKDSKCKGKYDVVDGYTLVDKICDELRVDLDAAGIDLKGTRKNLVEKCNRARIPIKKTVSKVISYGCIGKTKGVYQTLWERGLLNRMKNIKMSTQ